MSAREKLACLGARLLKPLAHHALKQAIGDDRRWIEIADLIVRDDRLLNRILDHSMKQDDKLVQVIDHLMESESSYGKIWAAVGDVEVGTTNQECREAWLEKTLKAIPAGSRILDAGAGECQYRRFCPHLRYVSQDFGQYDGIGDTAALQTEKWDQKNLDIVSDITAVPEPDGSFDAVMCVEVLEHVPDPVVALKEFARLLKPGGALILTAPFCSLTHMAPYHMATGFNRYFYHHHLPALGFRVREVTPNGNYFEFLAQETRRIRYVGERYANDSPNRKEQLSIKIVLKMLDRLSNKNNQSEELLNFGYFVVAEKEKTSHP